jgi:hypothetical protein
MAQRFGSVTIEEQTLGDTRWVALRARGAEWSWLTPDDALLLARHWSVPPCNRCQTAGSGLGVP